MLETTDSQNCAIGHQRLFQLKSGGGGVWPDHRARGHQSEEAEERCPGFSGGSECRHHHGTGMATQQSTARLEEFCAGSPGHEDFVIETHVLLASTDEI